MSYISATLSDDRKHVMVWERDESGKRVTKYFDAPYFYYIKNNNGTFSDIHGNKLIKKSFPNSWEFFESKKNYKSQNIEMFESDINPIYKVLSDNYYNKTPTKLNLSCFDIETDYDPAIGYATIENPYAPISAISLYHNYNDRMILLVVLPNNDKWTKSDIPKDLYDIAEIVVCSNEKELLLRFLDEIENTDVISGWNSTGYDIPYMYSRMCHRYNKSMASRLSFHNAPEPKSKEVEVFVGSTQTQVDIFGRVHLDYLEIFKKFETTTRPSFTLDAISEEILPEMKKIEYEGSLYDLYYNDFPMFCRYNVRDTEVLKGFEEKLGYLQLALDTYQSSTALPHDVLETLKIVECAIINKCHHELHQIVPDSKEPDYLNVDKFSGAYVFDPIVGLHEGVGSVDLNSLYPTTMRMLNASPETIVGQFQTSEDAFTEIFDNTSKLLTLTLEDGSIETHPANEWGDIFKSRQHALSAHGTIFDQHKMGLIPEILGEWFSARVEYKKKLKAAKKAMSSVEKESEEYLRLKQEYEYYNRIQFVRKILLNSTYGAVGNKYFKFYDIRLAISTTLTGRQFLFHMAKTCAKILDGEYKFPSKSIVYGDTDSTYFKTYGTDVKEMYETAKFIENKVNESFPAFSKNTFFCQDEQSKLMHAELDTISPKSIFIKKKMYIMNLAYADGMPADKMKVMGVQLKKTSIPKPISKKLIKFLENFLKEVQDWKDIARLIVAYKEELFNQDLMDIGLPKGIKGIESYTARYNAKEPNLRLPGHVAAAMFYNKCLEEYGDHNSPKIISGMKIKTYYLKQTFGKFKSIALPTDTKIAPEWFTTHFAPLVDRENQIKRLVDMPLQSILSAIDEYAPTTKTVMMDDLFEY